MEFHTLVELIQDAGYNARPYSGRGMYGTECVTFDIDSGAAFRAIVDLIDGSAKYTELDDRGILADVIRFTAVDDMGLGSVVYFPRVKWINEE